MQIAAPLSVLCRHTDQAVGCQVLPDVKLLLLLASIKFLVTSVPQFLLFKMRMLAVALPSIGLRDRQAGGSFLLPGEGTAKTESPPRPTLPAPVPPVLAEAPSPAGAAFCPANSQGGTGVSAKDR